MIERATTKDLSALSGQVRGFCTTKAAKAELLRHGVPERAIYHLGAGAEDMAACLRSYRGRPGWLVMAQDLRAFGETKRDVASRADTLEKSGIRVLDLSNPGDQTFAAQVQRANVLISGARFRDRRTARRQGSLGGRQKGISAQNQRNDLAPEWLIDRIVDHPALTWEVRVELLAPHFSESTLRRHYGVRAALKRA